MTGEHCITIVDDDESLRQATAGLFRSMGLRAVALASAEDFLASGYVEQTSCLVLDVHMPGMGGLKLQNYLTATGRRIPIVFVTAYTDDGVRTAALESGAACFLTKPFTDRDLLDALRSAMTTGKGR
jgi:FixJ family two-component response regulator